MSSLKILERDTSSSRTTELVFSPTGTHQIQNMQTHTRIDSKFNNSKTEFMRKNRLLQNIRHAFLNLFLPANYPDSVHPGYIQYQFFDSLQGLCSYLRSIASTAAVLSVAGVGDAEATVTSAVITWATNDGCAMIGGLLFSYYASGYFDSNVKEWRLFADIINDIGLTLEMILPYLSKSYIIIISMIATLCKVVCGIAAGATKGCITQHFAKDNIADLTAKESIQETFVSLLGMILGIFLAKATQTMQNSITVLKGSDDEMFWYKHSPIIANWVIFVVLTVIHIWSNYTAVKMLKLHTLNRGRLTIALGHIAHEASMNMVNSISAKQLSGSELRKHLVGPQDCNESMWEACSRVFRSSPINLGTKISFIIHLNGFKYSSLNENKEKHLIYPSQDLKYLYVALHENATDDDILKGFLHAMIVQSYFEISLNRNESIDSIIQYALEWTTVICEEDKLFQQLVECGWIRYLYLNCDRWRYSVVSS